MARPDERKSVLKVLFESEKDRSPREIADRADISVRTAKKWIEKLELEGDVKLTRVIGRTKMYELDL